MPITCAGGRLRSTTRPRFSPKSSGLLRGCQGSYETVRLFVQPLRAACLAAERATVRFETPPGLQSQIDWGQARVSSRHRPVALHVFVLTLGFSRRSFYEPCLAETLAQFLDAHERAQLPARPRVRG